MKLINKKDIPGLVLSAGVGAIAGLIYLAGKFTGQANAYEDCGNMLRDAIVKAQEVKSKE